MARLTVLEGAGVGSEHELSAEEEGAVWTLGRDPQNEVPIDDSAVSRRHCRIERVGSRWRLKDLASRNKTLLNGAVVDEAVLRDGDLLRVGDTELRFEAERQEAGAVGGASTIIKELPARELKRSFLQRLDGLEDAVRGERHEAPVVAQQAGRVVELLSSLSAAATTQEALEALTREAVALVDADQGAVALHQEGHWVVPSAPGATAPVVESVLDQVQAGLKAVLASSPSPGGGRSILAVPLLSRRGLEGILYLTRGAERPFVGANLDLVGGLGDPVGAILERTAATEALRAENRNLFRHLAEDKRIIGRSAATRAILDFIRKAAPAPMTVLISGETGTGKELVATAIHFGSPRRGMPFIAINCAALPENLVESELFGHERGAFTGAATRRKGRFELADGGTVFLDEVGELSLACQAKLLRLLEERSFERVGGMETLKVDVRVVAATNRNLLDAVAEGKFREDLFYRLNVLAITIAPLRERTEDIPLLAEHFIAQACAGKTRRLSRVAEKRLLDYAWPGNIRQLRNVLESAVVLGTSAEIQPADLILPEPREATARSSRNGGWKPTSLDSMVRQHILRVLEHTGGNKKRAAEILGIERCTLYAKLKQYESPP